MRFSVDRTWRRPRQGDVVLAGSPTRAFRLTPGGRRIVELIERGDEVPASARALVERFLDAGAIHPLADPSRHTLGAENVTAVIPVHLGEGADTKTLAALVGQLTGLAAIVIVDDASPCALPDLAAGDTKVSVVRRGSNGGPAAARNTGLDHVRTSHVVFIDDDVDCCTDDIVGLAAWLVASDAAVIAPRVRTTDDGTTLGSYEAARSPLDMGDRPARVRATTRVGWLPAAVLLCDVAALRSVAGFEESMRTGEDVDLVWRLDAAGFRCRYEPSIEVRHRRRETAVGLVSQRVGYGESTAALHRRHGDNVAPARGSWTSISSWVALALGLPIIAACTAVATAVMLTRKLRSVPNSTAETMQLAWKTHLQVGRNLAAAVTRVWWPIALLLAVFSRRARVALCAAAVVPAFAEWWEKRPRLDPVRFTLLRIVDDAAYGAGVWKSVAREHNVAPLLPAITRSATPNR
jgi:mycofactocin system glycosyltransferase